MAFKIEEAGVFTGQVRFVAAVLQDGAVTDDMIAAGAGIDPTKLDHQHAIRYYQADGSAVVSAIVPIYTAHAAGAIADVQVQCLDAPATGANPTEQYQFTVDVQIANMDTPAPESVLTDAVLIDDAVSDCEVIEAPVATAAYAAGDCLILVIVASGSDGTQGQGLIVTITVREAAD
jgi:hypothetical protein